MQYVFLRISRHREYFVHVLYWLPYSLNHRLFYVDVEVHCTLITITAGTLLKLSLRQDFNMASYRDLLMNVSQKVRYIDVLYALLTWLNINARVNVVLNRTVVDSFWRFNNLCGSHLQSQLELYRVSWWYLTLVIDLIGKLSHDVIVIVCQISSVKLWCYWLWRLEMSLVRCYRLCSVWSFVRSSSFFVLSSFGTLTLFDIQYLRTNTVWCSDF